MPKTVRSVDLPWWKKLFFGGTLVLLLLAGLELFMRVSGFGRPALPAAPQTTPDGPLRVDPLAYFAVCDRYLGVRNRANGSYHTWFIEEQPLVTTDEYGYRNGYGWPGNAESPIVLFVGDSIIFCAEVGDDQTGPSEVAKLLSEEFDVRVLNTGVRSYNTLQAKRTLSECFDRFPCIKLAVYTYCGNDLEETIVPNFRYPCKAPYLVRDKEAGRFREVEVADPVIPWGEAFFGWPPPPEVFSRREEVTRWLEDRSVLFHRCLAGLRQIDFGRSDPFEFPDGKHAVPPSDYMKWHTWAAENGGREAVRQLLTEMDQICRSHGAAFVATSTFNGSDLQSSEEVAIMCAKAGVRFVGLQKEFTDAAPVYTCTRVDGEFDEHYGPLGTKTYAKALAPDLKQILRSQTRASAPSESQISPRNRRRGSPPTAGPRFRSSRTRSVPAGITTGT